MGDQAQPVNASRIFRTVENISAHGLPNIGRAATHKRRLVWACLFLAGFGFFLSQSSQLIVRFLKYNVNVNVELGFETEATFPAVTFCNLNRIPLLAVLSDGKFLQLQGLIDGFLEHQEYQSWDYDLTYDEIDTSFAITALSIDILSSLPYANRSSTGHPLSDMMLSCTFRGYPCSPKNFTHFYNYLYGNCYTFNFYGRRAQKVTQAGPFGGLTMELYIDQPQYVPGLQNSAGVKVFISEQNQVPFPEDKGVIVGPGYETSIALKKVRIDRIGEPYTNCSKGASTIYSDFYENVEYSLLACEKSCVVREILKACQCADVRYRFTDEHKPCYSSNMTLTDCANRIHEAYAYNNLDCHCQLPCREDVFEETVSTALWPNDNYQPLMEAAVKNISPRFSYDLENDENFVSKNLVKLNVFMSSLQYQHIFQTPEYGSENLISDLGGQVGFWMGFSILTLFEIVEMIFDLIVTTCGKLKMRKRVSDKLKDMEGLDVPTVSSTVNTITPVE
ncbi:degenerin unc-8-like [Patiria miniata]|uniref:Uncharacterized protein n=1 Tax=Patiria miniata TaxID=46514 RepID=A0A914BDW8_PATMI|nr:degenerin unc-8-like [Patiria miniata]